MLLLNPANKAAGRQVSLDPRGPAMAVIGRRPDCDMVIEDPRVSSRHAQFTMSGGWYVCDLGSKHGTWLNGVKLAPREPRPLLPGDVLGVGPASYRASEGDPTPTATASAAEDLFGDAPGEGVAAVDVGLMDRPEQLVDAILATAAARNEVELFTVAVEQVMQLTACPRAAYVRAPYSGQPEAIVARPSLDGFRFSRSLIRGASEGQMVTLNSMDGAQVQRGMSIMELGIKAALCVPVMLGPAPDGYIYLDARGSESLRRPASAAAYGRVIASLCGLMLSRFRQEATERKAAEDQREFEAARKAQRLILPSDGGEANGVKYALHVRPARHVTGDLFAVIPLSDGRVGVFVGDVESHGAGPAVTMAAVHARLTVLLERTGDPAASLADLNRHILRTGWCGFMTCWAGVIDPRTGECRFVDAGHGYCLRRASGRPAVRVESKAENLPIAADDQPYTAETLTLEPGEALVLFSDGLVEAQAELDAQQLGVPRVIAAIPPETPAGQELAPLLALLEQHAGSRELADDVLIASLIRPG